MIRFIKKLLGIKTPEEKAAYEARMRDASHRMQELCINRSLQTGNMVFGHIDKNGNIHIDEIPKDKPELGVEVMHKWKANDHEIKVYEEGLKKNEEANTSDSPD